MEASKATWPDSGDVAEETGSACTSAGHAGSRWKCAKRPKKRQTLQVFTTRRTDTLFGAFVHGDFTEHPLVGRSRREEPGADRFVEEQRRIGTTEEARPEGREAGASYRRLSLCTPSGRREADRSTSPKLHRHGLRHRRHLLVSATISATTPTCNNGRAGGACGGRRGPIPRRLRSAVRPTWAKAA